MRRLCGRTRPVRKLGFTLIELLVVVAIIALLISILLPSLARGRAQADLGRWTPVSVALLMALAGMPLALVPGARRRRPLRARGIHGEEEAPFWSWETFKDVLPPATRDKVFDPAYQELLEDLYTHLAEPQFKRRLRRWLLWVCHEVKVTVLFLHCVFFAYFAVILGPWAKYFSKWWRFWHTR